MKKELPQPTPIKSGEDPKISEEYQSIYSTYKKIWQKHGRVNAMRSVF